MKKSTKVLIIVGSIIAALGITFVIMLFCGQEEPPRKTTGDPAKDCQIVVELMQKNTKEAYEYIDYVGKEYTDSLKKQEFAKLLETALSTKQDPITGDPIKDAETLIDIIFTLGDKESETIQEKSINYYISLKNSSIYAESGLFDEFLTQFGLLLEEPNVTFAELQELGFLPPDEK